MEISISSHHSPSLSPLLKSISLLTPPQILSSAGMESSLTNSTKLINLYIWELKVMNNLCIICSMRSTWMLISQPNIPNSLREYRTATFSTKPILTNSYLSLRISSLSKCISPTLQNASEWVIPCLLIKPVSPKSPLPSLKR